MEERNKDFSKLQKNQCQFKRKIRELEEQLKAEKTKAARAVFLKHETELELEGVREENARLQALLDQRSVGPSAMPPTEMKD